MAAEGSFLDALETARGTASGIEFSKSRLCRVSHRVFVLHPGMLGDFRRLRTARRSTLLALSIMQTS